MEQLLEILQPIYSTYRTYTLGAAGALVLLLILLVVRRRRKAERKSKSFVEEYILEIGEIHNKTGPIERTVKELQAQLHKYTGATHERIEEVRQELQHDQALCERIRQLASQAEQALHNGQPMQEVEEYIVHATEELEKLEVSLGEVDDFYKELQELELDVAESLSQMNTSVEQVAPALDETQEAALEQIRQKLSQAFDSKTENDPISAYGLLEEAKSLLSELDAGGAEAPAGEPEEDEGAELSSDFFETLSRFTEDEAPTEPEEEFQVVFPEFAEPLAEAQPEEEAAPAEPLLAELPDEERPAEPPTPVQPEPAPAMAEGEPHEEFVLAESWLRDFDQMPEPASGPPAQEPAVETVMAPVLEAGPAAEETPPPPQPETEPPEPAWALSAMEQESLLEEARAVFEVSDAWMEEVFVPQEPAAAEPVPVSEAAAEESQDLGKAIPLQAEEPLPVQAVQLPSLEETFAEEWPLVMEERPGEEAMTEEWPLDMEERPGEEAMTEDEESLFSVAEVMAAPAFADMGDAFALEEEPAAAPPAALAEEMQAEPELLAGASPSAAAQEAVPRKKKVLYKRKPSDRRSLQAIKQAVELAGETDFQSLVQDTAQVEMQHRNSRFMRELTQRVKEIKATTLPGLQQDMALLSKRFDPGAWSDETQAIEQARNGLQEGIRLIKNASVLNQGEEARIKRAAINLERAQAKLQEVVEQREKLAQHLNLLTQSYKRAKLEWNEMAQRYKTLKKAEQRFQAYEREYLKKAAAQLQDLRQLLQKETPFSPQIFTDVTLTLDNLLSALESRDYSKLSQTNKMVGV